MTDIMIGFIIDRLCTSAHRTITILKNIPKFMQQDFQDIFLAIMTGSLIGLLLAFYLLMIKPNQEQKYIHQNTKDNEETFNILWDCEEEEISK